MTTPRHTARDLAQIAIFAGLIAALGLIPPITAGWMPAPITAQTLGVMLAGALLGARKGFFAVLLFAALVAIGLPLLSGERGGIQYLTTAPSAGYPYGWMAGALVIGYLTQKILPQFALWKAVLVTALGGMVVVYAIGVLGTAINTDTSYNANLIKALIYLPGDAIKVAVTVLIARQVHRAYPGLIPLRPSAAPPAAPSTALAVDTNKHV